MNTNYLTKSGDLIKIAKDKLKGFYSYGGKGGFKKLSEFYTSRTTNVASVFFTDLFIISHDKTEIVKAGFNSTVKAVVKPNEKNKYVSKYLAELKKEQKEAQKKKVETEKKFAKMVKDAKSFIKENKTLVTSLKSKHPNNSKGLQDVAWKLSNRAANTGLQISKTAFYHAL